MELLLLLLLFHTFSVLVANPKQLLYTVADPARGLLNREKNKNKVWQRQITRGLGTSALHTGDVLSHHNLGECCTSDGLICSK